jgi:decaprenylphospho-beta-D-erythro-pentofuranosid-2-ulose 2-reductase
MIDALGNPQSLLLVGGTSEIGLAIVERLARGKRLSRVVLAGRPGAALEAAAHKVQAQLVAPAQVEVVALDLSDRVSLAPAVEAAFTQSLDVVVLAAGVLTDQKRALVDADYASTTNEINFVSPVHVGTLVAQRFRKQGRGVLVVLSSVAAERPRKDNFVYGAAKAGLDAWANGLADELAGSGVRVLVVRPGMVRTRMSAGLPEAPMTTDSAVVADVVAKNLVNGPTTIWVPAQLQVLMSGLRHLPRPVFRKIVSSREQQSKQLGKK